MGLLEQAYSLKGEEGGSNEDNTSAKLKAL